MLIFERCASLREDNFVLQEWLIGESSNSQPILSRHFPAQLLKFHSWKFHGIILLAKFLIWAFFWLKAQAEKMAAELGGKKIVFPKIEIESLVEQLVKEGKLKGDPQELYKNFLLETNLSQKRVDDVRSLCGKIYVQTIDPYFVPPYFTIDPYFAQFWRFWNRKIRVDLP